MDRVAPAGPVYQAGTLSGNPLAVAAGLKVLEIISRPGFYERLEAVAGRLAEGLKEKAAQARVPFTVNRVGSMFTAFFTGEPVTDYASAKKADAGRFARFFRGLLERGVYFPPSQFEAAFLSSAHTDGDVAATVQAAGEALTTLVD
jgi:glutamate-1-semialdehyde 2,1-aminomutase